MTDLNLSLAQARRFGLYDARELDAVAWEAHERALREFDPRRCGIDPQKGIGSFVSYRVRFAVFSELQERGIIPHPRYRHTRLSKERMTLHIEDFQSFDVTADPLDELGPDKRRAAAILAELPARERGIMRRRLDGESLSDIGASLGVSRERVRQLYERGLDRIRSELFKRRK